MASRLRNSYRQTTSPRYVERLSSSWILPTLVLAVLRALISLYIFVSHFFIIGYLCSIGDCDHAGVTLSHFSVLGFWALGFYYAFAAAHSFSYAVSGKPWLSSWPAGLRWLHSVLYASITTYPFIVTALYWAEPHEYSSRTPFWSWWAISQHGLNSIFAILEILLPRSDPHPWVNLLALFFLSAGYVGLGFLIYVTLGHYVYGALDADRHQRAILAGFFIGLLAASVILFIVVRYVQWIRWWLTEAKSGPGPEAHDTQSGQKRSNLGNESDPAALPDARRHDV
ncbi:hypothetical protein CERZMDRAFT_32632 [Cercospora zeae-maydis SCOH1-5]|uniref:FAR-17a/AIG1-like protein n=1 Tax=Cercospora zeae-maydis SCOH1-5 TaxID=717836 RepID=A0A6A6FUJ8_9PEZI|nr:hypothetical protein CERZMDRAFT_32632 [Cercospora zeae-maydis SCOH1-5]